MKSNQQKPIYSAPQIDRIVLDSEISLALQSTDEPPFGPNELSQVFPKKDPFQDGIA